MKKKEIQSVKIGDVVDGWFIGDYESSLFKTPVVEVGVKYYKAGEKLAEYYHKLATEFIVIVEGEAEIAGKHYKRGDIVIVEPGVRIDFGAITDVSIAVVRIPGVGG